MLLGLALLLLVAGSCDSMDLFVVVVDVVGVGVVVVVVDVVVVCASPNAMRDTIAGRREGTKVVGAAPAGGTVTVVAAAAAAAAPVPVAVVVGELVVLVVTVCGQ